MIKWVVFSNPVPYGVSLIYQDERILQFLAPLDDLEYDYRSPPDSLI